MRSRRPRRFADVKHLRSGKVVRSKRGAPGPTEERASKTRRTDPAAAVQPRLDLPAEPEDQIKDVLPKLDQNSVLLSLPGELRNRIYLLALEEPFDIPTPIRIRPNALSAVVRHALTQFTVHERFDFLGLTQTCSTLRTEFRPLWLAATRVPLSAVAGYIRVFYPSVMPKRVPTAIRERVAIHSDSKGRLEIIMPPGPDKVDGIDGTIDLLPLLKHHLRFPEMRIQLSRAPAEGPAGTLALEALLENQAELWLTWLKKRVITQVRITDLSNNHHNVRVAMKIVLKEQYAPMWMKSTLHATERVPAGYLDSLGLGNYIVRFGVAYP